MSLITTRVGKGSPLTTQELDANFVNLNTDKLEKSGGSATLADLTLNTVSTALHRSSNAITALFVYDTSKDSDGGAWTEKCQHTSWYNETINGAWLGAQASEAAARAVTGAAANDYYQLTTNGKFYVLNAGSGVTEVFRGNKRSFPKLAAIVADAANVTIYDLTELGRPMWMTFQGLTNYAGLFFSAGYTVTTVKMRGSVLVAGQSGLGVRVINFGSDRIISHRSSAFTYFNGVFRAGIAGRQTAYFDQIAISPTIAEATINDAAMTVSPDAPIDSVTGLKVPTIAVATNGGVSIIQNSGTVRNSSSTSAFTQVTLTPQLLSAGRADAVWYYAATPNALGASFALSTKNASTATDFNIGNTTLLKNKGRADYARTSGAVVQLLRNNEGTIGKGIAAKLSDTYNTGWLAGDIRRAYLANSKTADRSYKAATATETGTVTSTAVNTGNDLVAYSGFSAANYIQEPYSADLDFGTGEWSCSAWVNVPTPNAAAGTIVCREYSSGAYIRLGIDATNKLKATAYDGTTTRTATSSASYNTATWIKVRVNYTTDGKLAILVNGLEVASATGTALLTLNNSNAVLTIGNSYALDAPFPGSITLLKFSATVPTAEQALFMCEQEKHLFSIGARCVLPASTNVLDLAYDDATDTWSTLQATYEASWSGLVRTSTQAPSAGTFSKTAETSGVQLLGRITTNPGVDVRMPAKNLRPKDMPKDTNQDSVVFDFDAVTSQTDFVLPVGYTARVVYSAGAQKRLGSTKDYTVLFDGFRETVRFGTAPGNGVWVQIHAVKEVA